MQCPRSWIHEKSTILTSAGSCSELTPPLYHTNSADLNPWTTNHLFSQIYDGWNSSDRRSSIFYEPISGSRYVYHRTATTSFSESSYYNAGLGRGSQTMPSGQSAPQHQAPLSSDFFSTEVSSFVHIRYREYGLTCVIQSALGSDFTQSPGPEYRPFYQPHPIVPIPPGMNPLPSFEFDDTEFPGLPGPWGSGSREHRLYLSTHSIAHGLRQSSFDES